MTPQERKQADREIRAHDKARGLESGLWHMGVQLAGFKTAEEALWYDHYGVKGGQRYTTSIPASENNYFEALVSPRGHIKVFGKGGAVVFSSVFNKHGTRKAIEIFTEGAKKAGMIPKDTPKVPIYF